VLVLRHRAAPETRIPRKLRGELSARDTSSGLRWFVSQLAAAYRVGHVGGDRGWGRDGLLEAACCRWQTSKYVKPCCIIRNVEIYRIYLVWQTRVAETWWKM